MGLLIDFLIKNYIYFVFVAIILVLALIGYIVDSARTEKLKKEYSKKEEEMADIPLATFNENVKIGETVNKTTIKSNASVKDGSTPEQTVSPTLEIKTAEKK